MKKIVTTCLIAGLLGGTGFCAMPKRINLGQEKQPAESPRVMSKSTQQQGHINVNGTSEREMAPNSARITFSIETSDKNLTNATNENKKISAKAIEAVTKILNEKNGDTIKTTSFNVNPEYSYQNGKSVFERYRAVNTFEVKTKNPYELGKIIDTALNSGATRVNDLKYLLDVDDVICNELIAEAIQIAHKRAQSIASALSSKLGGVKQINSSCSVENQNQMPMFRALSAKGADMASNESFIPLESGVIKVKAYVDAQFWIIH